MRKAVDEAWSSQILQYLRANPEVLRAASPAWREPLTSLAQIADAEGGKERAPARLAQAAEREMG
ncbi:MAG TPA: hypothetical protein VEX11_12850 [Acetobacteraceae bacterium]|jgi:hypothetical protein|nr:hypothetical protein [Acetobacteraceae bacterium]